VPEVLLSGDHEAIRRWRRAQQLLRTAERRPDLFLDVDLRDEDRELIRRYAVNVAEKREEE
jgi:tRNA (guanine37-N1)-methyltransferase